MVIQLGQCEMINKAVHLKQDTGHVQVCVMPLHYI